MVKEFVPIGVPEGQVAEKVFLSFDEEQTWVDVTHLQCLAADGPVAYGIMLPETTLAEQSIDKPHLKIIAPINGQMQEVTRVRLKKFNSLELKNDTLQLYHCAGVKNKHMGALRRRLIISRLFSMSIARGEYEGVMTKYLYEQIVAIYSYPRQVYLIQIGEKVIFPIDICFYSAKEGHFAFGLKVKNRLNQLVQESRKVSIYTISSDSYQTIYKLSKSFRLDLSKEMPSFIGTKLSVDILGFENLSSQIFYAGSISSVEQIKEQGRYLFHMHFVRYLSSVSTPEYTIEHLRG